MPVAADAEWVASIVWRLLFNSASPYRSLLSAAFCSIEFEPQISASSQTD